MTGFPLTLYSTCPRRMTCPAAGNSVYTPVAWFSTL
jgi:hypothetical protein